MDGINQVRMFVREPRVYMQHSFERDTLVGGKISAEDSGRVNIRIRSIRFMHHFHAVSPSWTWFIFLQFLSVICRLLEERSLFVRKAPSLEQPIIELHLSPPYIVSECVLQWSYIQVRIMFPAEAIKEGRCIYWSGFDSPFGRSRWLALCTILVTLNIYRCTGEHGHFSFSFLCSPNYGAVLSHDSQPLEIQVEVPLKV